MNTKFLLMIPVALFFIMAFAFFINPSTLEETDQEPSPLFLEFYYDSLKQEIRVLEDKIDSLESRSMDFRLQRDHCIETVNWLVEEGSIELKVEN